MCVLFHWFRQCVFNTIVICDADIGMSEKLNVIREKGTGELYFAQNHVIK